MRRMGVKDAGKTSARFASVDLGELVEDAEHCRVFAPERRIWRWSDFLRGRTVNGDAALDHWISVSSRGLRNSLFHHARHPRMLIMDSSVQFPPTGIPGAVILEPP